MADLNSIMQPYIDSGDYTEEELEKMRKLEYNKLQEGTRETSWWKGEEGWIPDELQPWVDRPEVKKEEPGIVEEFLEVTNDQKEIEKRKEHSVATSSLQPGDKEIPYKTVDDKNYRQDGTIIYKDDVYDPDRLSASDGYKKAKEETSWWDFKSEKKGGEGWLPDEVYDWYTDVEADEYEGIPVVDFIHDLYFGTAAGLVRSEGAELSLEFQEMLDRGETPSLQEIDKLMEHDLKVAALGQTKESLNYASTYEANKEDYGGVIAWLMGVGENPTFLSTTITQSLTQQFGLAYNVGRWCHFLCCW